MLSAAEQELIAAAIDGELTSAERRAAKELLRRSEEARALYSRLKRQAASLRQLPQVPVPIDFSCDILGVIREQGLKPTPLPPERNRHRRYGFWNPPLWAAVATAAAVLMTVTLGSYLFFANDSTPRSPGRVVSVPPARDTVPATDIAKADADPERVVPPPTLVREEPVEVIVKAPRLLEPKATPAPENQELANPVNLLPTELFDIAKVRMSLILPLRELDEAYPKQKLKEEIVKDEMIRLDLFCKDLPRALEALQAQLKSEGHEIFIDAFAAERLKKKPAPELLLYTESMSPSEVAALLERLGGEDKKLEAKKPGQGAFDNFVLAPSLKGDLDKLARLLGVSLPTLKTEAARPPVIDLTKPISEKTASQLAQNLRSTGKGDKSALILGYSPWNITPTASREIKAFLERRGERKPGTKPLMLVLRLVG